MRGSRTIVTVCWSAVGAFAETARPFLSPTNIFAPVSTPAQSIFDLSVFVLEVTALIFVLVFGLLVYAVVKFRKRRTGYAQAAAQLYGISQLQHEWPVMPVLIVVGLFLASSRT